MTFDTPSIEDSSDLVRVGHIACRLHLLDSTNVTTHGLGLRHGNRVALSVCDDGVGIDPAVALETGRSLGCQLVNDLVGQLEGELVLGEGQGASVTVRFGRES